MAGTEQVVVGDLVYYKRDDTGKEVGCVRSECEDENSNDADDCSHLDEATVTDLPEGKHNLVKVRFKSHSLFENSTIISVEFVSY